MNNRLLEAADRYLCFARPGESLTETWTGCGTYSDYRYVLEHGLMEWVFYRPAARHTGWLRLTEAGADIVGRWLERGEK